tara:strand:+ start:963 stop:1190 length:228 start_codon:yes stop_codon:yes gene_type:complete
LVLEWRDNGSGFEISSDGKLQIKSQSGIGLIGLASAASQRGGQVTYENNLGAVVTLMLPKKTIKSNGWFHCCVAS